MKKGAYILKVHGRVVVVYPENRLKIMLESIYHGSFCLLINLWWWWWWWWWCHACACACSPVRGAESVILIVVVPVPILYT